MNDQLDDGGSGGDNAGDQSQQEEFLIVGLGASAGGVEALKAFFEQVPADSGAAYVVILHLSPNHESKLAEILQGSAAIPVHQVQHRERVHPDCVYVIPPSRSLSMDDGHVTLSDVTVQEQRRAPIDIFFRTLAETHRNRAVGVVLSGTGSDGSAGIKRVKERGGLCIAQDPPEAAHSEMPRHAIATDVVDDVLAVAQIPARIIAYKQHRESLRQQSKPPTPNDDRAMRGILSQLRLRTGHDFTTYKSSTVLRRVERRVAFNGLPDFAAYERWLREHPDEATALLKDLLISVTEFFRDAEAFAALERDVIPKILEGKTSSDYVRVWIAGCATGEEVYSLAILLCEQARDPLDTPTIQLFATDIDEVALAKARAGLYSHSDVASVSAERLRRYFVQERNGYRVRTELREIVLFATHNVTKHPPYSHLDLITCRNLLIYINREAQKRVLQVFHFGLNTGGFLFLGSSESLDGAAELFAAVDKEARIFQSLPGERRAPITFSQVSIAQTPAPADLGVQSTPLTSLVRERPPAHELHRRVLEQYAPPSVLISAKNEVVHLSERAGRYMRLVGGAATLDLLSLVRQELAIELRAALYEASRGATEAKTRPIPLAIDGVPEQVSLIVRAVPPIEDDATGGYTLVLFSSSAADNDQSPIVGPTPTAAIAPALRHIQNELAEAKAQLQATSGQYELQQEELKASNEELQSINEELRSTSEELETGKEELQSYNEELSTINQELKVKIEELIQANNDTRNFMNSTETATIFLDRDLRIKRFTPRCAELFNLISADVGRPLPHLTNKLKYDEMVEDIHSVLRTLHEMEREVETNSGAWFIARLLPYRTEDERIDGVVLTFVDITDRKRAEDATRTSEEQFRRAMEDAPIPVIMQAEDGEVLQLSRTWMQLTGYDAHNAPPLHTWLTPAFGEGADAVRAHVQDLFTGSRKTLDQEFQLTTTRGEERWWSFSASSPGKLRDGRRFIVGMAVDVTDGRRASEALRRSEEHLRLTLESVSDYAIFTMSAAGIIDSWNTGAERIFGYTAGEAVGQNLAMVFTPEDRANGVPEQEMRTARQEGSAADERWHLRRNGDRFYASGVLSRVGAGSNVMGFSKVAQDLTQRRHAEEELRQARADLEARVEVRTRELAQANEWLRQQVDERQQSEQLRVRLLGQLVQAQENERRRISRELHDQLGQQITALQLKLSALKGAGELSPEALQQELQALARITTQLDRDVDFLVWELRPTSLDDLGLFEALDDYVKTWSKHVGVAVKLHAREPAKARLPEEIETTLYRIAQEALNNVAKHAGARSVNIVLERGTAQMSLIISDDGRGFDPQDGVAQSPRSLGLVSIRERASLAGGAATIEAQPGQGTTVFVQLPLPGSENNEHEEPFAT